MRENLNVSDVILLINVFHAMIIINAKHVRQMPIEKVITVVNAMMVGTLRKETLNVPNAEEDARIATEPIVSSAIITTFS